MFWHDVVVITNTLAPRYNAPRYSADLAITRFFCLYSKSVPPSSFEQRQIISQIVEYFVTILVEVHKFAVNQAYYKKFLQRGPSNILRSLKINSNTLSLWDFDVSL
jgi:hypothetical protein